MKKIFFINICTIVLLAAANTASAQAAKTTATKPEEPKTIPIEQSSAGAKENKNTASDLKVSETKPGAGVQEKQFSQAQENNRERKTLPSQANVSTLPKKNN